MVSFHWLVQGLLTILIVYISWNFKWKITTIHLGRLHTLNYYTKKVALRNSWEENLSIKELISIFTLWIFHFYQAPFHQHLQMDYTYLSWNDVRLHKCGYPWWTCHELTLICSVCADCRSFRLSSLMTCHHVWHITGCWREGHDECHLWNRTFY